jgi:hypothetical protein
LPHFFGGHSTFSGLHDESLVVRKFRVNAVQAGPKEMTMPKKSRSTGRRVRFNAIEPGYNPAALEMELPQSWRRAVP